MSKKGRSEQGLFGTIHHYDEHGKKVGRSEPGLFGGYTNYDANGNKIGHSDPGFPGSIQNLPDGVMGATQFQLLGAHALVRI